MASMRDVKLARRQDEKAYTNLGDRSRSDSGRLAPDLQGRASCRSCPIRRVNISVGVTLNELT